MAKSDGTTLEKLYLELGLDLSTLQSDILAADKTVTENLGRLNRERNLIKIRMQADISGLDAAKDAAQILAIQEKSLNEQLSISKDRLAILEAAYKQVASNQNSTALAIQNAEKQWQKERIEVGKLEAALKALASQKVSIDTAHVQDSISKLTAKVKNIKIQAEIDTTRLKDAGNIFDAQKTHIAAVTRELELQREKYAQLQRQATEAAKVFGGESSITLNLKTNFLQQYQEIQKLEQKLKELQSTNINLQIRADNAQKLEQTINEKIARINATVDLIRVKTEVDTSKITGATAEFDKAKRQVTALNQELTLQNSKLAEMQKLLSQSSGTKAINLAADIQKQIQAIDQLKAKIKELNSIQPPKSGGLLGDYLNIKGDIAGQLNNITSAFAQLKGATSSADNAVISVLGTIDAIPSPVGKAITALAGLPIVFAGIENSIVDMMKASAAAGDSVYVMSRGFQMSVADTGKFTTMCKTAGVEVNDLASTLKRVQQQIIRGGDDGKAAQWLRRYGESAYDANGKLKDLNEMTLTLSRALKKAQAEGRGMEFILATMRNASADTITAIEDAEGVYEQASHIVKAGLANPALAHEVQGNLNAMGQQSAQLGASFKNAFLPVANEIVPRMTERMGNLTQLIKDNKDVILDLGKDFAQVWGNVEDTIDKIAVGLSELAKLRRDNSVVGKNDTTEIVKKYKDDASVQNAEDILKKEIATGGYSDEDVEKLRARQDLYKKEIARHNSTLKELLKERRKIFAEHFKDLLDKYKDDDSIQSATDLLGRLTDAEKAMIEGTESGLGSLTERAGALYLELQQLRKEMAEAAKEAKNFAEVTTAGVTADIERQGLENNEGFVDSLRRARKYLEDADAIRYKMNHSDYETRKNGNWRWLQEQLPRDRETSLAEYKAILEQFRAQDEQIEKERADKLAEIREQIAAGDRTAFENRLADIEKDKQSWIQAGMDKLEADKLAQKKREQLEQEVADKVSDIRQSINAEFQTDLEKQIAAIQKEQQAWVDMGVSASEAAELAGEKMEQAFEKAVEKAKSWNQSLEDKIFALEHSQYEQDVRKLKQEVAQKAQEAQKLGIFDDNARRLLNRYYNNALRDLNAKAGKGGNYTKSPTGANSGFQFIDYTQAQQQQIIGTFTSEARARNQVIQGLSQEQQELIRSQEAIRDAANAQRNLAQSAQETAQDFQQVNGINAPVSEGATIIHGDQVTQLSREDARKIAEQQGNHATILHGDAVTQLSADDARRIAEQNNQPIQQAASDFQQIVGNAILPNLQKFDGAVQQTTESLPNPETFSAIFPLVQEAGEAQKSLADSTKDFPSEYFKNLADGAKSVSEMQQRLTESTMNLIDAQSQFRDALLNFSGGNSARNTIGQQSRAGDGILNLTTATQKATDAQDDFALTAREADDHVQGIRDILQGKDAVADANAEATPDTSENSSQDLLTPLNNIDETAKSILSELQSRQDENELAEPINELKSEVSTQLSDAASQLSENIATPIQDIAQKLQDTQDNTVDDKISEISSTLSNDVAAKIQEVAQSLQDRNADESAGVESEEAVRLDDIASKVQSIFDEMRAQQTAELEAQPETPTENIDYLTPLTNIRDNVSGIFNKLQEATPTQETAQTENISEILSPITQNINTPLSDLRASIDNKEFKLPDNLFPTEVIVQPLNTISRFVEQILSVLSNREPPKIEISPNMDIDLGGAYVFDDNLKRSLVNDITSNIVSRITEAVQSATASSSRSGSYGFGT